MENLTNIKVPKKYEDKISKIYIEGFGKEKQYVCELREGYIFGINECGIYFADTQKELLNTIRVEIEEEVVDKPVEVEQKEELRNKILTDIFTKEDIVELANKDNGTGGFLPSQGDFYKKINLEGEWTAEWLKDRGFEISWINKDTGVVTTKCGIEVSTNGYCSIKKELTPLEATYEFYQRCREIQKSGKYEINISSNYSGDGIIDILEKKPIRLMERICFENRKDIEKLDELINKTLNKYLEKEAEEEPEILTITDSENYKVYTCLGYVFSEKTYSTGLTQISVRKKIGETNNEYLPDIYVDDDISSCKIKGFKIQTTSYGTMGCDDIEKIISGYNEAIKFVKVLEKRYL